MATNNLSNSKQNGTQPDAFYLKLLWDKINSDRSILPTIDFQNCSAEELRDKLQIFFADHGVDATNIITDITDASCGLQAKLMGNSNNMVHFSVPYEYLTDEEIRTLSNGDKALLLQGIKSNVYYRTIDDQTYRIFVLDHGRMQQFRNMPKQQRDDIFPEIHKLLRKGANVQLDN